MNKENKFTMTQNYISKDGLESLKSTLNTLKKQGEDLISQISVNREQETGDESENSEYLRLMAELNAVKKKEAELREFYSNVYIVDFESKIGTESDAIRFGCYAHVIDLETEEEKRFRILGVIEAKPKEATISYLSPIGSALIGKRVGDIVAIDTPSGDVEYEITRIHY